MYTFIYKIYFKEKMDSPPSGGLSILFYKMNIFYYSNGSGSDISARSVQIYLIMIKNRYYIELNS